MWFFVVDRVWRPYTARQPNYDARQAEDIRRSFVPPDGALRTHCRLLHRAGRSRHWCAEFLRARHQANAGTSYFLFCKTFLILLQENPAVAREDVLQPMRFLLQYRPSKSSKVDDFHLIWKGVGLCDFLLVINSNLGPTSHLLATIRPSPTTTTDRQTTTVPQTPTLEHSCSASINSTLEIQPVRPVVKWTPGVSQV